MLAREIQNQNQHLISVRRWLHLSTKATTLLLKHNEDNPARGRWHIDRTLRLADYLQDLSNDYEIHQLTTEMLGEQLRTLFDLVSGII